MANNDRWLRQISRPLACAALLSAALALLCSCAHSASSATAKSPNVGGDMEAVNLTAAHLSQGDPVQDLKLALARGDFRFIGISGFSRFAPGVEYEPELTDRYGMKMVVDFTDSSPQDKGTAMKILNYAQAYNLLLFRHLWSTGQLRIDPKSGHPEF